MIERRWWIVVAASAAHSVNTGLSYFGISAYFPSFEREFGWSRTAISGAFSLARIESGILGPFEGYLTDRLGPPRMMFMGIILTALGFFSLSMINSLPMLYAALILGIVLGSSLGYNMPLSVVIANLFRARRSLAFGIFRVGPGLSGSQPRAASEPQFTLREAMSTVSFWTLTIGMALRQMVTEGVSVHFVILLVDRGWSTEAASGLLGISALISAPARLGMGWLGDLLDKRRLIMGLLISLSFSVFFMGWTAHPYVFTPFMAIYSLAYGGLASLQEPIRADYFGTQYFASIQGMSRSITSVGIFLGPITAGFFYDLTKSYTIPFTFFAFIGLLSTLSMFLAKPPGVKRPSS